MKARLASAEDRDFRTFPYIAVLKYTRVNNNSDLDGLLRQMRCRAFKFLSQNKDVFDFVFERRITSFVEEFVFRTRCSRLDDMKRHLSAAIEEAYKSVANHVLGKDRYVTCFKTWRLERYIGVDSVRVADDGSVFPFPEFTEVHNYTECSNCRAKQ